jgi:hypothetical protein
MKKIIVGFKVLTYITFYLFYLLPTLLYLRLKYGKGNAAKKNDKYFEILVAPSVVEFIKYYILMILIIIMIVKIIKSIY